MKMDANRKVKVHETKNCLLDAGSLLSGGGSAPHPKATAVDWVNMVNDFQKGSLSTRLGIPMIYGIDAVHGHNNVVNATIFPHNIGLGTTRQDVIHFENLGQSRCSFYFKECHTLT
jgi:beta-glucosidase-like glycosyl hydrolase